MFEEAGFEIVEEISYLNKKTTLFYDILTPLAAPAVITKNFTKQLVFFPSFRRFYSGL